MQSQWTIQDAKNKFSEVVNAACSGTPQFVSKRGQPAVVVLSAEAYGNMLKMGESCSPSFAGLLLQMPQEDDGLEIEKARQDISLREVDF